MAIVVGRLAVSFKNISILYLILFLAFINIRVTQAAPVLQKNIVFTQADGSTFIAVPYGDEWNSGYETKEGFTILFEKLSGNWVYAERAGDGSLKRTNIAVSKGIPNFPKHLRAPQSEKLPEKMQLVTVGEHR